MTDAMSAETELEEWRPVAGWDGYEVSNIGRVRSTGRLLRSSAGNPYKRRSNILNPWLSDCGYPRVTLHDGHGGRAMVPVHRLVAKAFVENPSNFSIVNHLDHNRANNRASNLEWCTQKHNLAHARSAGRMPSYWLGKRSATARLDDATVQHIRDLYSSGEWSLERIGRHLGVSKRTVGRIVLGQYYRPIACPLPAPPAPPEAREDALARLAKLDAELL